MLRGRLYATIIRLMVMVLRPSLFGVIAVLGLKKLYQNTVYSEVIYTAFENANIAYYFQNSSSQLFPYLFVQVGSSQIYI